MEKDKDTPKLPDEREILRGRETRPDDALLRESADALKGASPVSAHDRTLFALRQILESILPDGDGSLRRTILAELGDRRPLVARHFDEPRALLQAYLEPILAEEEALAELVRATDARWGREYAEKPHFERPDRPADPDDPYTRAGVRKRLERCLRLLG